MVDKNLTITNLRSGGGLDPLSSGPQRLRMPKTTRSTGSRRGAAVLTDFLAVTDLAPGALAGLVKTAARIKTKAGAKSVRKRLDGKSIVLLFEKPSLRTRVSFEVGIHRLGGHAVSYAHMDARIGQRESVKDYAKNLERFCHAIVARVFEQSVLEELAVHASVPIVNALSNSHHPCQAVADVLTLTEHLGEMKGLQVAYIGDGNNVALSLAHAVTMLGGHVRIIAPAGYQISDGDAKACATIAKSTGGSITLSDDPASVKGADCVYTDTWASMHDTDAAAREKVFAAYQVNASLMGLAAKRAVFMHCLPAHRGHEVTDEVMDSPQSVVYDQAENRLHAQNAILLALPIGK